ncbi:MAG TPA: hypothetical protein VNA26_08055, partial [Chitinophagaceae bacterium]|nr:hypothetical protein [Chitinophagaceae bacterium]
MNEDKKIPDEEQKDEGLSPKEEYSQPIINEKLQTEVQNEGPVVKNSEETDNLQQPTQSNEDTSQPQPDIPLTLNPVQTVIQPGVPKPSTSYMEVHPPHHVTHK